MSTTPRVEVLSSGIVKAVSGCRHRLETVLNASLSSTPDAGARTSEGRVAILEGLAPLSPNLN